MSAIAVGNKVPITLDVGDANDMLYVRATIYSPNLIPIISFNLLPKGDGIYSHDNYFMPDFDYITIKYVVYDSNTYTNRAGYYDTTESYSKNTSGSGGSSPELINTINKALSDLRKVDITVDVVEEDTIQAVVDHRDTPDTINIEVEESSIVIEVESSNEISGDIESNEINIEV